MYIAYSNDNNNNNYHRRDKHNCNVTHISKKAFAFVVWVNRTTEDSSWKSLTKTSFREQSEFLKEAHSKV